MSAIWCKICREFCEEMKNDTHSSSVKGVGLICNFFYYCIGMKNVEMYTIKMPSVSLFFTSVAVCGGPDFSTWFSRLKQKN